VHSLHSNPGCLLAWLIDFEPRPYDPTKRYNVDEPGESTGNQKSAEDGVASDGKEGKKAGKEKKVKVADINTKQLQKKAWMHPQMIFSLAKWLIPVMVIVVIVLLWSHYQWRNPDADSGCMYWAGDHYQRIPCNAKVENAFIVALDTLRLKYFKKITIPDTITRKSKGFVWYSKIDNKIEFFTADGNHPVEWRYRLKPISDYIIKKYIHPGITSQ
jgi:hypothetical protein